MDRNKIYEVMEWLKKIERIEAFLEPVDKEGEVHFNIRLDSYDLRDMLTLEDFGIIRSDILVALRDNLERYKKVFDKMQL